MKRSGIIFLSVVFVMCFSIAAFADGGPARLAGMGNIQISVIDAASQIDLYTMGYAAGIFTRPAKSAIVLYPEIWGIYDNTVDDSPAQDTTLVTGVGGGTGYYNCAMPSDGILLYFSKDTALAIKPILAAIPVNVKETTPGTPGSPEEVRNTLMYSLMGEIEFMQKLGDNLAVAATGGYSHPGLNMDGTSAKYDESAYTEDKIEYALSLSMLPQEKGGLSLALSAGNKTGPMQEQLIQTMLEGSITLSEMGMYFNPMYLRSNHFYETDEYTTYYEKSWVDVNVSGFDVSLGASAGTDDNMKFSAKAGLLAGVNSKVKIKNTDIAKSDGAETTTNDDQDVLKNGIGADTEVSFRAKLGAVTAGIKGNFKCLNSDFLMFPGGGIKMLTTTLKTVAGASYDAGGFIIPLELYYNRSGFDITKDKDAQKMAFYEIGARLGTEIKLSEGMAARCGIDTTFLGSWNQDVSDGEVTDESAPAGSKDNRWMASTGYFAGIGFKSAGSEMNFGAEVLPQWTQPKSDSYKKNDSYYFKLMADLRFYL